MNRTITCFAEGRGDSWHAICLDFDIAAQGRSFEDARDRLIEAVKDYLEYVETLPEAERSAFRTRRVPLHVQIAFVLRLVSWSLFSRKHEAGSGRAEFSLACPA